MKDRKIDKIVNQMASYYGTITKASFIAEMLDPTYDPSSDFFQPPDPNPEDRAANALLDLSEGGKTINEFLKELEETLAKKPESSSGSGKSIDETRLDVAETFCITFEPGVVKDDENLHMNGSKKSPFTSKQGSAPGKKQKGVWSIKDVLGVKGEGDKSPINGRKDDPDKVESPNLSVVQIYPVAFGPGTTDTSALSLFLNAIPTLEFSRCIPFIDLVAVTDSPPVRSVDDESGRLSTISLAQFLIGADNVKFGEASGIMATSVDADVFSEFLSKPPKKPKEGAKPPPPPPPNIPQISTAGMEMFTSPQTLVNADEVHYEADSAGFNKTNTLTGETEDATSHPGGRRAAPVIDRFRPFMSLKELSFNVAPGGGMFAFKTANLKLTLHDRSRLAEIQPFVKPDAFGGTHLLLEYGWAHPEYKAHQTLASNSKWLIGHFLGALRCREKYRVVNTSYSFDEVGQVEVDIKLTMLGSGSVHRVKIGMGGKVSDTVKTMEKLTKAISEILKKNGGTGMSADAGGEDFLAASSSTSGALSMNEETQKKIAQFIRRKQKQKQKQSSQATGENRTGQTGTSGGNAAPCSKEHRGSGLKHITTTCQAMQSAA